MSGATKKLLSIALLVALLDITVSTEKEFNTDLNVLSTDTVKANNEYRLPGSVIPKTYDITLSEINFEAATYVGKVEITADVVKETREIVLHKGKGLNITKETIKQNNVEKSIGHPSYNDTTDKYTILLDNNLEPNKEIIIDLVFTGTLRDDMIGFYRSSYIDKTTNTTKWLAATQFEAVSARHAFPCFDEPALKALFTVNIIIPVGYDCLGNMQVTKHSQPQEISNTSILCKFEPSVKMSTYLVAFVISDFKSYTQGIVSGWARTSLEDQFKYGVEIAGQAITYFEKLLNQSYSIKKMDLVAVPDFSAGAMENWGLLTFRETASLYDQNSADITQQKVAAVVVHEVAHQWFGNLVTPEWWSYLWLSEGFARYYQSIATNQIKKDWKMDQQFVVDQHQLALGVDGLESSVSMTRDAETQSQIEGMGGTITYSKGASILRMMELTFGSEIFNAALKSYLEARKYDSANPSHLWEAFQKQWDVSKDQNFKLSIATVMKTWTEQPGFPYISVTVKPTGIKLSQQRFYLRQPNTTPQDQTWWVPITLTSSSQANSATTKPVYWLSERNTEIPNNYTKDDWIILNVQSAGFYRVNYDIDSWSKIIQVLNSDDFENIPVLNRAAIIDDLLNLARAELLSYDIALQGLVYLKRETNYLPFKSAFTALDYLIRKFADSSDNHIFKEYVMSLYTNVYERLTYDDQANDDRLTILLRQDLNSRACSLGNAECIAKSKEYFENWKSKKEAVPKNQRSVAYCTAIKYGTREDWEFLKYQYQSTSDKIDEHAIILSALGCSKNTEILEQFLRDSLVYEKSGIRKQDVASVFNGISSTSLESAEYMLEFIEKNYDLLNEYHKDPKEIGNLISGVLQKYPTKKLIERVETLLDGNVIPIASIKSSIETSLKVAKIELSWFEKYSGSMTQWIKTNDSSNTTDYRLPGNIIPSSYSIHLIPNLVPVDGNDELTFTGTVKISATVKKNTNVIKLHINQIEVQKVTVQELVVNGNAVGLTVSERTETKKYNFLNLYMKNVIKAEAKITIEIEYKGILNSEMRGFYKSSYKDNGITKWLAASHLEPVGARRMFPCFDEPALKGTFDISVDAPKNYNVVSNMKVKKQPETPKAGTWTFDTTPMMSTYLVAILVSDFKSISSEDKKYTVYANPLVANQLEYSLDVMKPTVDFFESKFNHLYTLPKLDMVALPDFSSGAMENWGLMTYRETNMLYDLDISSLSSKQSIRNVIAHEIAHQWFGDLVSPLWWDYLWLSEGFARYFQYYAYSQNEVTWNLETQFVVDHLQTSFSTDASTGTHPITAKVYSPSEISEIFDSISYAKAGSIIRMLEKLTGPEIFYKALHDYLESCKFSTGTPEKLFEAFQNAVDANKEINFNVTEVMNSWTRQKGFPVINVTFIDSVAELTQSRFYLRPSKSEFSEATWIIPINYATRSNPNFNNTQKVEWMERDETQLIIKNASKDWVIFNVQQTGYYRVNYDETMWRRIIAALNCNESTLIHEINRASLIDDLLNLGRVGYVDYDLVLAGVSYLSHEKDYGPWKAAYSGFAYLTKRFVDRPEVYDTYRDYLLKLIEPISKGLGFDDAKEDKHTDILLRKLLHEWLCALNDQRCVDKAIELFKKEKTESVKVPPNQRIFVYNTAIRKGGSEDWQYLWDEFVKTNHAIVKLVILNALSYSQDTEKLNKLLDLAVTSKSEIRLQDAKRVFTNIIDAGPLGVKTTLKFIENNYEKMRKYFGDDSATKSILSTISKRLSTEKLVEKFETFVNKTSSSMPTISKSLQTFLKRAKTELYWYEKNSPKIFKYLEMNTPLPNYRLPTSIKPESYDIHLTPYFEERNFTFDGKVLINVKIEADTHRILLHKKDLDIEEISSNNAQYKISFTKYNDTTQILAIYFENILKAETKLQLIFKYSGVLADDMRGFYRSQYVNEKGEIRWLASTQFEPVYARKAFPCFDEPSFKAKFTIHISRPVGYRTLSNMGSPLTKDIIGNNNRKQDDYHTTVFMSPYLVAFVVSDFESVSVNSSKVSVWSRPQLKKYMNYSSVVGDKALDYLESFTGIPYPFERMNFVAVPDFNSGAMENWGLVTFREYGLTFDNEAVSASYKRYINTVVSHELVHMWFGNLVTCDWWDYTWLNEGFAEYLSYLVSNASEPSWQLLKQFVVQELQIALDVDSATSSHAMNNKVLTGKEAQDGFDKITYEKSSSILRMFHHSFGQNVFQDALRNYLDKHKFNTSKPEYLYEAVDARLKIETKAPGGLNVDATTVMKSWIEQAGYPVVMIKREGNAVTLSQERFLVSSTDATEKEKTYWIPITYTTEEEHNFNDTTPRLWLNKESQNINVKSNKWFILNIQEIGFYRVNYDNTTWKQLIKVLNSVNFTTINEINRAQIIDDSLNLARAGYIDYELALEASKYLTRETSFLPLKAYFNGVSYLAQRIEGNADMKKLYGRHVKTLISNVHEQLGFQEDMIKDTHLNQLNRELILTWACKYEYSDCESQANTYYLRANQTGITPNIAFPVYCKAVELGSSDLWNELWGKYTKTVLATDYITILKALGCSKNTSILERYLDLATNSSSPIRRQDVGTVFSAVYTSSQIGLEAAIDYIQKNLDRLHTYFGEWSEIGSLFKSLSSRITNEEQIKKLEKLKDDKKAINIKSSLESAIKTAKNNMDWFNKHSTKIQTWLETNYKDRVPDSGSSGIRSFSFDLFTKFFLSIIILFYSA